MVGIALPFMVRSAARPVDDTDVWWNLRLGQDLLHQAWWDRPPQLSSFATADWVPTEPLPEVVGATFARWFGLPGLAWLFGLALAAVLITTYVALRQVSSPLPAAVTTLLTILASAQSLTPRPQMVSLCLLPVVVVAWWRTWDDLRPRWWLVPLMYVWSCCHGFWFVGGLVGMLVAVAMVAARRVKGQQAWRLLSVAGGSMAVVLATPAGPRVLLAPFAVRARSSYIIEWHRTDLISPSPAVAILMLVTGLGLAAVGRRLSMLTLALAAASAFFVWYSTRTVSVGGILAAVLLAAGLHRLLEAEAPEPRLSWRTEALALGSWAAVCLVALGLTVSTTSAHPAQVPTGLDPSLDRLPARSVVFDNYELGGWLEWRHPTLDPYIDPLADAYPTSHLDDYVRALQAQPGWQRILVRSRARAALLQRGEPLRRVLQRHAWRLVGADRGYVLLESP